MMYIQYTQYAQIAVWQWLRGIEKEGKQLGSLYIEIRPTLQLVSGYRSIGNLVKRHRCVTLGYRKHIPVYCNMHAMRAMRDSDQ